MTIIPHNPADMFPPYVNYAHAVEVSAGARMLYVSGLNGFEQDGTTMPVCAQLLEPEWLIEVEAIAAAST
jgi:enamine deaminase RidA (YjgF/YER057c/UK114 family)